MENYTLKVRNGTDTRYSWKKAEVKNTIKEALNFDPVDFTMGMYMCRTAHR